MTFICLNCLNIELRTQPLIILIVIAGTDKERPGCSKIRCELTSPHRESKAGFPLQAYRTETYQKRF
jgi:hypothetical protein